MGTGICKKNQNFANTDTLANLYNKIGDKKNAKCGLKNLLNWLKAPDRILLIQKNY
jgi:hypothetical protein